MLPALTCGNPDFGRGTGGKTAFVLGISSGVSHTMRRGPVLPPGLIHFGYGGCVTGYGDVTRRVTAYQHKHALVTGYARIG
jgi:hypothetical protein